MLGAALNIESKDKSVHARCAPAVRTETLLRNNDVRDFKTFEA